MIDRFLQKLRVLLPAVTSSCVRRVNLYVAALTLGQSVVVISFLLTGCIVGVRQLGSLQLLELAAFDQMLRLQPDEGPDSRIVVVSITEKDLKEQGWPLTDEVLAQVLANLQRYQPRAIGLDLYRDRPVPPGHSALLKQLQAPNIITIIKMEDPETEGVKSLSTVPTDRLGFNDFVVDPDGVVRRNFMYAFQGAKQFYSLSLRLSLLYLAAENIAFEREADYLQLSKARFYPIEANSGGYQNIDDAGYQILISYRSPKRAALEVGLTEVLNQSLDPSLIKDKVILIGTTAHSVKDAFFTPYSAVKSSDPGIPGVYLHAQLTSQILSTVLDQRPLFWFWSQWQEGIWIWAWALVGGVLAWRLQHPLALGFAGTLALTSLGGVCFILFTHAGWVPLIPAALSLVTAGGTVLAYKLLYNTFHDGLTGLPNRALLLQRLSWAIGDAQKHRHHLFAVLFLDFDRFKVINDSLGHRTGDQLLIHAASRLKLCLRSGDTLARIGGDQFAILLEDLLDVGQATQISDQLQQKMTLPFKLGGQDVFTSASIGIAFNQAQHEHQPEDLLRDAHTALYRAKALGKARHEVFATGMRVQVVKRLQLETDLHRALEQHELQLYYQPIVSLATEQVLGFEALVRWKHAQHGFVSPAEFIPVAEETELIIPLGKWVFQEACHQLRVWQAQFPMNPPLMVSVNLSAQQFSQPDLVEYIEQVLKATGLEGHSLKLEMTESIAMHDVEATISLLLRLRALNLQLVIDDFGTGYSSLSYLHRFPVNTLKVDRSFVSRMGETSEDAAIVQTIILLGHNLGMDVVAEGVETAAQRSQLQALGCEYGQGYFFSRPLDWEAATALLASSYKKSVATETSANP